MSQFGEFDFMDEEGLVDEDIFSDEEDLKKFSMEMMV